MARRGGKESLILTEKETIKKEHQISLDGDSIERENTNSHSRSLDEKRGRGPFFLNGKTENPVDPELEGGKKSLDFLWGNK